MYQRILVPLDGSNRAEEAIPVACRIARAGGGTIILLRVVSAAGQFWPYALPQTTLAQPMIDSELASARQYLQEISKTDSFAGIQAETVTLYGSPAAAILAVAQSYQADLIVLCSHGYTGLTRWVMGSVAEKVSRHSAIPVFIVREHGPKPAGLSAGDSTRPLRALVPLDGSAEAKAALEPAAMLVAALAGPGQGAIHLARIVKPAPQNQTRVGQQPAIQFSTQDLELSKAKTYLSATTAHIREKLVAPTIAEMKFPVTWSVALDTDVASSLISIAENGEDAGGAGVFGGCDLIAIATHGREGLQHWALGSVTERVLATTRLPLLIIRPPSMVSYPHPGQVSPEIAPLKQPAGVLK